MSDGIEIVFEGPKPWFGGCIAMTARKDGQYSGSYYREGEAGGRDACLAVLAGNIERALARRAPA